nr:hypothetical protein [Nakamurella panacisegetis]
MPETVLVAAARTPIGRAFKGSRVDVRPDDLCASIIASVLASLPDLDPADVVDVFVAAGVESVPRAPGFYDDGAMNPRFTGPARPDDRLDMFLATGRTAEYVARRHGLSRAALDDYALLSQRRTAAATAAGFFAREITPWIRPDGAAVLADDSPRPGTTAEGLAALPPAFAVVGVVTAGNSCPLNDGAAAVVVTGLDPDIMGLGPVAAVRSVLNRTGM